MTPSPLCPISRIAASCRNHAPGLLLFAGSALLLSGCTAARKRPAIPWQTAAIVHPIVPSPLSGDAAALPEVSAIPQIELPEPTGAFLPAHANPPRPHVSTPSPAAAAKDDGPIIVPQISAEESAAAQQEANASLNNAERNLEAIRGHTLNASQIDIVNKVKNFMDAAREAARVEDWPRARSLAKKAEVLSQELTRSL